MKTVITFTYHKDVQDMLLFDISCKEALDIRSRNDQAVAFIKFVFYVNEMK